MTGRALAGAALALGVLAGRAAGDPGQAGDGPPDGFDHVAHDARVTARVAKPPPCSRCHSTGAGGRLVGAPGHAACFGDCHGPPPPRTDATAGQAVCRACHRPADLARKRGAVDYPPYRRDPDFALTMSHASHGRVARGCRACHGAPPEPGRADAARAQARRAPHARCAACHARKHAPGGVTMAACGTCHAPARRTEGARAPRRTSGAYPVRSRFSHRRHLSRGAGACRTCHAGVVAATGLDIPTPKKQHCRSCHDGKRAFSMIEPSCRRCHGAPERETPVPLLPRSRFSHRAHQEARPNLGCRTCHALDRAGAPITILRGHTTCSSAGCHRDDFADPSPITCSVCHVRSEPWRNQHADPTPADVTEFGAVFSHRTHLAERRAPCARCHRPAPDGRFRPRPGHTACAGEACHTPARGGAQPALSDCSGCHEVGLVAARAAAQTSRPWSVRERFTHAPHAVEPGDRDRRVACTDCHAGTPSSERLADMPSPRKQSCARCHDGRAAFKLTGHTCSRCHTTPAGARP